MHAIELTNRLKQVKARIKKQLIAQNDSNKQKSTPTLVAVSKTKPISDIKILYQQGHLDFGENYLQEALPKIKYFPQATWHYIGKIQSKKIRQIIENFEYIHSVASIKHLKNMDKLTNELQLNPKIFLQVNICNEPSKDGFEPQFLLQSLASIAQLKNIMIIGLMAIPKIQKKYQTQLEQFNQLIRLGKKLQQQINVFNAHNINFKNYSIGMSADLEAAIDAGSTYIRIGKDIFGNRNK